MPEVLVTLALVGLVAANGWQAVAELRDERAAREAARGVAADLRRTAVDARRLGRTLAVEFDLAPPARWRVLADGNGNGVTTADVDAGIDRPHASWTPVVREGRAAVAITRPLPGSDGEPALAPGSTAVRLGVMSRLVFTPRGTSGAASIHLAGPGDRAYLVRVLGTTQRIRVLCLSSSMTWETC